MRIRERALMASAIIALAAADQPAAASPLSPFLLADQGTDEILLSRDINGDGDVNDIGEVTTFFDNGNASGLANASSNVFALSQGSNYNVWIGDGDSDTVYRLRDNNGNGTANDAGEAQAWFSGGTNAAGYRLNTPNGIAEGPDGAIYIVEADTSGSPTGDWVYRTQDLNNDGDANDAGEATQWLNLKAINAASSPFEIRFDGNAAYVMDTAGGTPDVIYRAVDTDGNGSISGTEVNTFATEANSFGANFDFAMDVDKGSLLTWQWLAANGESAIFRLTDLDGSGMIDAANEVIKAWSTNLLDAGHTFLAGFGLTVNQFTSEVLITSNTSGPNGDWIISLFDLDGDGTFFGPGEWQYALDRSVEGTYPDRARNVSFYSAPPVPLPAALPLLAGAILLTGAISRKRKHQ
jgi:hypothetical protein